MKGLNYRGTKIKQADVKYKGKFAFSPHIRYLCAQNCNIPPLQGMIMITFKIRFYYEQRETF